MTADPRPPPEPVRNAAGNRSVLLVDDDDSVHLMLRPLLESAGYDATFVSDGKSAIAAMDGRAYDVIVSDIQMPGMTGIELLRVVRARDLDVPVILITGNPSIETAMDAVSLGALQYLRKPVAAEIIVKALDRASRLHRMARIKREALKLLGREDRLAGDRAGRQAGLDRALEGMSIAFQPIVDIESQRIYGYEALMRTSEASLPNPGAVLDAAERLDRIVEVGRRVRSLCADAFGSFPPEALLFVNLHPRDLLDPDLYEAAGALTPMADRVVLEITERATVEDVKDIQAKVAGLRALGFRIAIDDLGAGYAGLSSFVALEPDIVKLDMSLVRSVHESVIRQRLVESMNTVCTELGIQMVAEGIETEEECDAVRRFRCTLMQGYLFARPGPPFPLVRFPT